MTRIHLLLVALALLLAAALGSLADDAVIWGVLDDAVIWGAYGGADDSIIWGN